MLTSFFKQKKSFELIAFLFMLQSILGIGIICKNNALAAEANYLWPVPNSRTINQPYGNNGHDGLDIGGSEGTPIVASKSGTVIKVLDGDETNWIGYGKGVVISHGDGYYTHYAHMSSVTVVQGQNVSQGQQIGGMGATGNATGVHLHFAIATSQYGGGNRINNNTDTIQYIYSGDPVPTPTNWSNKTESVSETNAVLGITYNAGSTKYFGYVGLVLDGVKKLGYDPGYTGSSFSFSFDLNQYGKKLEPGRTYKYNFYVNTMDGDIIGPEYSFTTKSNTAPTLEGTWSNPTQNVTDNNAVLGITYNAGSSKYFGYIGLYVNGSYACGYDPGYTGLSYSFSFDLNKDAGMTLQPGQTYKYQLYVNTMDGSDIFSPEYSFTTTSSSGNTNPVTPSGGNVGNMDIVNYACQFEGKPYVWGTHGPDTFDCSGFVYYVFQHFGRSLSLSSADYWNSPTNYGTVVSEGDALPGDVVSWSGHVGIYIGDGYVINALNADAGVCKTKITSFLDSDGNSNPAHKYIRINGVTTGHTHSYTATVTKQPTCTETGIKTFTCSCGDSYTEAIPAKGHQYQDTVIAPTMTENGSIIHTCSGCGDVKQDIIPLPTLKEDGWYYCKLMPTGINTAEYEVQYNNYFEKEQKDSPGEGWTKAETVKNEWVNSGEPYQSEAELPTSDARVLVKSVYYHFCGPNAGNVGNYEMTGNYVHYDEIVIGQYGVNVDSQGDDEGHTYYLLSWADGGGRVKCASGVTCDGSYGTHGERCQAWYKMNTYQDRVKEEIYKYTKTSGWVKDKDSSAASAEVRFKKSEDANVPGDLNGDGTVNSTDVILLRRYIAGGYGVSINEDAADVNADGTLNSTDVILIRRYIAGGYGVELK